jgi:hypothetical protein
VVFRELDPSIPGANTFLCKFSQYNRLILAVLGLHTQIPSPIRKFESNTETMASCLRTRLNFPLTPSRIPTFGTIRTNANSVARVLTRIFLFFSFGTVAWVAPFLFRSDASILVSYRTASFENGLVHHAINEALGCLYVHATISAALRVSATSALSRSQPRMIHRITSVDSDSMENLRRGAARRVDGPLNSESVIGVELGVDRIISRSIPRRSPSASRSTPRRRIRVSRLPF